jgi:hypothetical protein
MGTVTEDQRRTVWRTGWGVAVAASAAFSIGYGASHYADPSIGAERTPAWPLFVSIAVVIASVWFLLAPNLHQWPFDEKPGSDPHAHDDVLTGTLSEAGEPAPIGSFRIDPPASHEDRPTG